MPPLTELIELRVQDLIWFIGYLLVCLHVVHARDVVRSAAGARQLPHLPQHLFADIRCLHHLLLLPLLLHIFVCVMY